MQISIHQTPALLGAAVAKTIISGLVAAQAVDRFYLLGCPGGRSPKPIYAALAEQIHAADVDLSNLILVMMDEYLQGEESTLEYVCDQRHFSCHRFAEQEIVALLNRTRPVAKRIPAHNVWFPDPDNSAAYDVRIAASGGVDLFILASGASDGHVGFNPPGSQRHGPSCVVRLADTTREDNLKTFPEFQNLDEVPRFGVTVGVGTIADQSNSAVMVLTGTSKRLAFERISNATGYDPSWPATVIAECHNAVLHADQAAAAEL